jgi:hypothetical protein
MYYCDILIVGDPFVEFSAQPSGPLQIFFVEHVDGNSLQAKTNKTDLYCGVVEGQTCHI